jgi:hypothetical protein
MGFTLARWRGQDKSSSGRSPYGEGGRCFFPKVRDGGQMRIYRDIGRLIGSTAGYSGFDVP